MRTLLLLIAVTAMSCARAPHPPAAVDAAGGGGGGGGTGFDASPGGDLDAPAAAIDAPAAATDATAAACKQPNILHGDGHHNPGQDCMGSCHDHGFSLAGTLYLADGVTPASNATVTVVDKNGFSQDIIASTNGNFFSFIPVTFPVTITASMCPSTQVMVTPATTGGCNAAACHGGAPQGPAHL